MLSCCSLLFCVSIAAYLNAKSIEQIHNPYYLKCFSVLRGVWGTGVWVRKSLPFKTVFEQISKVLVLLFQHFAFQFKK